MGSDNATSRSIASFCPPTEILMKACAGDLEDLYAEFVNRHIRICPRCRMKTSAVCGLLKLDEDGLSRRAAEQRRPIARAALQTRETAFLRPREMAPNWRRRAYNCGDPEQHPRSHLVAARRISLATVDGSPWGSAADYRIRVRSLGSSAGPARDFAPAAIDDVEDLTRRLRTACKAGSRMVTVFIPAEASWLADSFLSDDPNRWRVFLSETTPLGQARTPLTTCGDGGDGVPYRRAEASFMEGVRMSRWLFDKQNIPAGRLLGMTLAALGRVMGRGDADDLIPPDDPLIVVIPADDPQVDDDQLIDQGYGHLVSTP